MTKEQATLSGPDDLFDQLRSLLPSRPLTYGQALTLAERQSGRLRTLLGVKQAAFDLSWLFVRADVSVELRPEYRMPDHTSGITTNIGGELVIFLNATESRLRQRFTLAHELKHVLDFHLLTTTYSKLGRGDAKLQADQIEWLCNRFAATLLMPKTWVNRLWTRGIQDAVALAHVFQVSTEAMQIRLETLGYSGPLTRPPAGVFFRQPFIPELTTPPAETNCLIAA
jgi:hypothetical protein